MLTSIYILSSELAIAQSDIPLSDHHEVYDLILIYRNTSLGIVQIVVEREDICIDARDVMLLLGYKYTNDDSQCVKVGDFKKIWDLNFEIKWNTMSIHLDPLKNIPINDLRLAYERHIMLEKKDVEIPHSIQSRSFIKPKLASIKKDIVLMNGLDIEKIIIDQDLHLLGGEMSNKLEYFPSNQSSFNRTPVLLNVHWRWNIPKKNAFVNTLELGRLNNNGKLNQDFLGIGITNQVSGNEIRVNNYLIKDDLIPGTIIEWYSAHERKNKTILITKEHNNGLPIEVMEGLNEIDFKITTPGNFTRLETKKITLPVLTNKSGQFKYHFATGLSQTLNHQRWMSRLKIDYGLGQYLNIGSEMMYTAHKKLEKEDYSIAFQGQIPGVIALWANIDPSLQYDLSIHYHAPTWISLHVRDRTNKTTNWINRDANRITSLHWSSNVFNNFGLSGIIEQRHFRNRIDRLLSIQSTLNVKNILFKSNYALFSQFPNRNYGKQSSQSRHTLSFRFKKNMNLSLETQLSHHNNSIFEGLGIRTQYQIKNLSSFSYAHINPQNKTTILQFGCNYRLGSLHIKQWAQGTNKLINHWGEYAIRWILNDEGSWHMSNPNTKSSGFEFKAFHDLNSNGQKEISEPYLTGLELDSNFGLQTKLTKESLIANEVQPNTEYSLSFKPFLKNHPEYMLDRRFIQIKSPFSGIKKVLIPVRLGQELNGVWVIDGNFNPLNIKAFLWDDQLKKRFNISTFSDASWMIDSIPNGHYELKFMNENMNEELFSSTQYINIENTSKDLIITVYKK